MAGFKIKSYVSFHSAWDYFGRRYGLEKAGVIQASPGREPTPQEVQSLIKEIRKRGIRAIFAEAQFNPRTAQVIAREAGAKVVMLDPEGSAPERRSYLELMRYNLDRMKEAMD